MDLKQIEAFVHVAEVGSFSGAARLLGVAQPALSRQIRQLEVELRQTLLLRDGRGARPTEAGALLLEHGRAILHRLACAREELAGARGRLAGHAAIGLPPSLARLLTVPLARAFREQLPEATLTIGEGLSSALAEGLRQGRFDLALLYDPPPAPDIELEHLFAEALFLVSQNADRKPRRALALADLARLPLVIPSRPNAVRLRIERELARLGLKPTIALEIDGVSAILALVADGFGHAVLPRDALAGFAPARQLRLQPFTPALTHPLVLAAHAQRQLTGTQQAARGLIVEALSRALGSELGTGQAPSGRAARRGGLRASARTA